MKQSSLLKPAYRFSYQIQHTNEIYNAYASLSPPTHIHSHQLHHPHHSHEPLSTSLHSPLQQQPSTHALPATSLPRRKRPLILIQEQSPAILEHVKKESQSDMICSVNEESMSAPGRVKGKQQKLGNTAASKTSKKRQQLQFQHSKVNFSRKGLALISSLILEVLQHSFKQNRRFSCGEISGRVLDQFCKRTTLEGSGEAVDQKERKTIKRRVYDSINVLIALGKIKKEQKWLYVQPADPTVGREIIRAKNQNISSLQLSLLRKQQSFNPAKRQYQKLKALKNRNSTLTLQRIPTTTFQFPLLIFHSQGSTKQLQIQRQGDSGSQDYMERTTISALPLYLLSEMSALESIPVTTGHSTYSQDLQKNQSLLFK